MNTRRVVSAVGLAALALPMSGCMVAVGTLGACWHYERNTEKFELENAEREKQGQAALTREEWDIQREAETERKLDGWGNAQPE